MTAAPVEGTPFLVSHSQYPDSVRVDGIDHCVWELGNKFLSDLPSHDWRRIREFRNFPDCPLNLVEENAAKIRASYVVKIGSIIKLNLSGFVDRDLSTHFRRARARLNTSSAGQD